MERARYVLHVEDDDLKARAVERLVRRVAGVGYRRAATATEALAILQGAERPLAVLSDWNLPFLPATRPYGSAGATVVAIATAAGLPVLVVSGSVRPEAWALGRYKGARWALDWPREVEAFVAEVSRG